VISITPQQDERPASAGDRQSSERVSRLQCGSSLSLGLP
jgi:hypothetical protein